MKGTLHLSRQSDVPRLSRRVRIADAAGVLAFALALALAACSSNDERSELPFETVLQEKIVAIPDGWSEVELFEDEEPAIFVIARLEEIGNVERWIFPEALTTLDYQREFALVVFQGYKAVLEYGVNIRRVSRKGNIVDVSAEFQTPAPHMEMHPFHSSPYHVIRIQKAGRWKQEITFHLIVNDETILSRTHYIP